MLKILGSFLLFGPVKAIRIILLGGKRVAAFRQAHGREPTAVEWEAIEEQVDREVNRTRG